MLKLCRTKMTLPPHPPIGPYLLLNIPSLSELSDSAMMQIHEHCTTWNYARKIEYYAFGRHP